MDQEEQLTSRKRPRSHVIKKNKAKEEQFTARRGEQDGDPSHLPPTSSGEFGVRRCGFRENLWVCCGFRANSQVVSFGETLADFPQTTVFLRILKLMILS
jgi:hypothetical protein